MEVHMIEISRTKVMNFEGAIRWARNPLNSWVNPIVFMITMKIIF